MLVNDLQTTNAASPIEVALLGIVYSVKPAGAKEFTTPLNIKQRLSSDAYFP